MAFLTFTGLSNTASAPPSGTTIGTTGTSGTGGALSGGGPSGFTGSIFGNPTGDTLSIPTVYNTGSNTLIIPSVYNNNGNPLINSNYNGSIGGAPVEPIIYPPDLAESGLRLAFSFYKYNKDAAFSKLTTSADSTLPLIFLPLPDALQIGLSVLYQPYNAGYIPPAINEGYDLYQSFRDWLEFKGTSKDSSASIPSTWDVTGDALKKIMSGLTGPTAKNAAKFGMLASSGLSEDIQGYLSNYLGLALNPNTTLALKAPQLRTHVFTWTFAPRNVDESDTVYEFINIFQQAMSPEIDPSASVFLKYPRLCWPEFIGDNGYMYKFKPCLIQDVKIDNAAAGRPSFFSSSHAPTIISFGIQMTEVQLYTNIDARNESAYVEAQVLTEAGFQAIANSVEQQEMNVLTPSDPVNYVVQTTYGIQ